MCLAVASSGKTLVAVARRDAEVCRGELDEISAIRHCAPVARIARWVGVGARPLDVHAVALICFELAGGKVVRQRREHLHNVATPAFDVEIVDPGVAALARGGPSADEKRMRAVLKADEVCSKVARHNGVVAIVEAAGRPWVEIARGNVVPHTHYAPSLLRAQHAQHIPRHIPNQMCWDRLLGALGAVRTICVGKLVLAGVRRNLADGRRGAPLAALNPHSRLLVGLAGGEGVGPNDAGLRAL
eukprot:scaffold159593_cov32-Tisochrysis_lutea.AAC.2